MLKAEFLKMIKNKKFVIIAMALFLITIPDLFYNWWAVLYPPHFTVWEQVTHPCKAAFLSANSIGHIPQIVIDWLLPIILLIMGCDSSNREKKLGTKSIYLVKENRRKYYTAKLAVSFSTPAIMFFIICIINWFLSIAIFRTGPSFAGLEQHVSPETEPTLFFQFNHPFETYFCYILIFCFSAGLCGLMCQALSLLITDIKKVYLLSFIIWFSQMSIPPYLANAMQPFTETSMMDTFLGILRFTLTVLVIVIICLLAKRRNKDEI